MVRMPQGQSKGKNPKKGDEIASKGECNHNGHCTRSRSRDNVSAATVDMTKSPANKRRRQSLNPVETTPV